MTGKYYKTKRDIPPTAPSQSNILFESANTDYISKKMWEKFVSSKFYAEMYKDKSGYTTKEVDDKHISVLFLRDMLVILFNERDINNDAIYIDKERVFKNRPNIFTEDAVLYALNAIRSNCVRFARAITSEHKISMSKVIDDKGNFKGVYVRFKSINLGDK